LGVECLPPGNEIRAPAHPDSLEGALEAQCNPNVPAPVKPAAARSVGLSHWALFFTTLCVGSVIIAAGVALGVALTAQDTCATFQATEVAAGRRVGWAAELPCSYDAKAVRTCDLNTEFTYTCPAPTAAELAWLATPGTPSPYCTKCPKTGPFAVGECKSASLDDAGTNCPVYGGPVGLKNSAQCQSFACATALTIVGGMGSVEKTTFLAGLKANPPSPNFIAKFRLAASSTSVEKTTYAVPWDFSLFTGLYAGFTDKTFATKYNTNNNPIEWLGFTPMQYPPVPVPSPKPTPPFTASWDVTTNTDTAAYENYVLVSIEN